MRGLMITFLITAAVLDGGCSRKRFHKNPWFVTEKDAARYLEDALEDPNADHRREAIERLSRTRYADHPTVAEACTIVARSDRSPSVRCAAIRLIAESRHPQTAETLLAILNTDDSDDVGLSRRVRLNALRALYFLVRNAALPSEHQDAVVAAAVRLLGEDSSRDVRIAAALLLGEIPHVRGVNALVAALDHPDFGVVHHAERSLTRLTGVGHDRDPRAWRSWLASTDEPFAGRGKLDHVLEPSGEANWWQQLSTSVKRVLSGFRPKPKQQ